MKSVQIEQIRQIEEISGNAWRPAVCQQLWGWQLGCSGGTSRRVNCVLPHHMIGPVRLKERLRLVNQFYQDRERQVVFKISPATLPTNLPTALMQAGYEKDAPTSVQITNLDTLLDASLPPSQAVKAAPALEEGWFQTYTSASGYASESLPIRRGILMRIAAQAHFVLLLHNDIPAATGLGVYERGWLGMYCVVTRPDFRRNGFASQIMHALAAWGKVQGAEKAYLQVMEDNTPGLALYRKLGFEKLYDYYYLGKTAAVNGLPENALT